MAKTELYEDVNYLLRIQRHDFLNHLQVIHAMVQLGKNERALSYIEELAKDPSLLVTDELTRKLQELTGGLKNGA